MKRRYAGFLLIGAYLLQAQPVTFPTTTLSQAMTGWPAAHQPATVIHLASNAAVIPGINPISRGPGTPIGHTNVIIMIDQEAMCVDGPIQSGGGVPVERGCQGTRVLAHSAGATAYVGPPGYYVETAPFGGCNAATLPVLPVVYIDNAGVYNCVASHWAYQGTTTALRSHSTFGMAAPEPVWHVQRKKLPWSQRFMRWLRVKVFHK